LIGEKAFDANWIIADLNEHGAKIVISQRPKRKAPLDIDLEVYKWRHLIENFFGKLKEFKRVTMLSKKTDTSFAAMITLAVAIINSRWRISTGLVEKLNDAVDKVTARPVWRGLRNKTSMRRRGQSNTSPVNSTGSIRGNSQTRRRAQP